MTAVIEAKLTIGLLADTSGCNVPTIRYYEEIGLLPKAQRRPNGHRIYSSADRDRLTFIRRSRDFGFSIEQIRQLIDVAADVGGDCAEAKDVAQSHLEAVRLKMAELRALESGLAALVQSCSNRCLGGPRPRVRFSVTSSVSRSRYRRLAVAAVELGFFQLVVGCNAMTAMPIKAMPAPAISHGVGVMPSTSHSHTNATAMYMPP